MCLGSTPKTDRAEADIAAFTGKLQSQAAEVFGDDDKVFNTMMNTAGPIFSAGPNQHGFNAAELSSRNALAVTQGANTQRFLAASAKGMVPAGAGNGLNISGATTNIGLDARAMVAGKTAEQLATNSAEDWSAGRENWTKAGEMVSKAPDAFAHAGQFDAAIQSGQASNLKAAESQDAKSNWWVKPAMAGIGMAGNLVAPGLGTALTGGGSPDLGGAFKKVKGLFGGGGGGYTPGASGGEDTTG